MLQYLWENFLLQIHLVNILRVIFIVVAMNPQHQPNGLSPLLLEIGKVEKPIIITTVEETDIVTEIGIEEIEAGGETMTETEGEAEVVIDGGVETVIVVIAIEGIGTVIEIGI